MWWLPEIGVPPNHPLYSDFPLKTIHFWIPLFMETPIYVQIYIHIYIYIHIVHACVYVTVRQQKLSNVLKSTEIGLWFMIPGLDI